MLEGNISMPEEMQLRKRLQVQAQRLRQAERDKPNQLAQTRFIVTLGILMVLPIVAGGYLGIWLDDLSQHYSVHWTISLLLTGVIVGFANVYFFLKD